MVAFHGAHAPRWMCLDNKPHPLGNEYHTIACCEMKIMFRMELVQRKDKPLEGAHASPEFEEETGSKIASLFLCITK